ncbi:hypothetical protein ACLOJK_034778 [Asimina triloba]
MPPRKSLDNIGVGIPAAPPQQSLDDIDIGFPDVPPIGPLEAITQHGSNTEGSVTRAKFRALIEVMRALQQQLSHS